MAGTGRFLRRRATSVYAGQSVDLDEAQLTLDMLRALGWLVRHGVPWPGRPGEQLQHLLVGPSGVFVLAIDTVETSVDAAVPGTWQQHADLALAAATDVASALPGVPVTPVVCFTRTDAFTGVAGSVFLCSLRNVVEVLSHAVVRLDDATLAAVRREVADGLAGEPAPAPAAQPAPDPAPAPVVEDTVDELTALQPGSSYDLYAELGRLDDPLDGAAAAAGDRLAEEAAREQERLEADQVLEAERVASAEARRAEEERRAAEQAEQDRLAALEAARVEDARREAERHAAEQAELERAEAERLAAEQAELARAEAERAEAERAEAERLAAEEAQRLENARLAAEQAERERLEAERQAAEQAELARVEAERLEAERLAAEQTEVARADAERLEAERLAAEQAERERADAERAEAERLTSEQEAIAHAEAVRAAAERVEAQRLAAQEAEAERRDAERRALLEAQRREAEQAAAAQAEAARLAAQGVATTTPATGEPAVSVEAHRAAELAAAQKAVEAARERKARLQVTRDPAPADPVLSRTPPAAGLPPRAPGHARPARRFGLLEGKGVVAAAVIGVLVVGGVALQGPIGSAVGSVQALFTDRPPARIGEQVNVGKTLYHPRLRLRAGEPEQLPRRGEVAIPFTVTNNGTGAWTLETADLVLLDRIGISHQAKAGPAIRQGPVFAASTTVAADATVEGYLLFDLPPDLTVGELRLSLAPAGADEDPVVWFTRDP